jgi:hypothetical protein
MIPNLKSHSQRAQLLDVLSFPRSQTTRVRLDRGLEKKVLRIFSYYNNLTIYPNFLSQSPLDTNMPHCI